LAKNRNKTPHNQPRASVAPRHAAPYAETVGRTVTTLQQYEEDFEGPLPHPQILVRYNEIVPGSAERIIDAFVNQANHRMSLEKTVVEGGSKRAYLGIGAGFTLSLVLFAIAYATIMAGHAVEGVAIASINLAALVGTFVYGTNARQHERREKSDRTRRK
jgi:uncharacterized membrane protein